MLIDIVDPEFIFLAGEMCEFPEVSSLLCNQIVKNNEMFSHEKIKFIRYYSEKRIKSAGIVVLQNLVNDVIKI